MQDIMTATQLDTDGPASTPVSLAADSAAGSLHDALMTSIQFQHLSFVTHHLTTSQCTKISYDDTSALRAWA